MRFGATWTWGRTKKWLGALAPDEAADVADAVTDLVGAVVDPDHPDIAHHRHLAAALDLLKPGSTEGERGCSREERELGAPLNLGEWS